MDLIISHKNCPDGFCAAFVASTRFPEAEILFLDHGLSLSQIDEVILRAQDKNVLMIDYSLPTRDFNDALARRAKSFHILDHHKSAQATLQGAPYAFFDMKRSGAGLTWDFLFGYEAFNSELFNTPLATLIEMQTSSLPRPWWVSYVEDKDLWNWALPDSRMVNAYLGTLEFSFPAWEQVSRTTKEAAMVLGRGALAHIEHYVREAVKQAQTGSLLPLMNYKVAVLNVPYLNCSEVGNELAKTHDVSLTYFERGDQTMQFSLRSIGDIDVSTVAKNFGGGGHRNAAGFQLSVKEGRTLVDTILGRI